MKKSQKKLSLNRETLHHLESARLSYAFGMATGTCAGSGCASCGQNLCNPSNITDPLPATRPQINPIDYALTSTAVKTYATTVSSLQL